MGTYTWKIGAPAGFGVMTTGLLMSTYAAKAGYDVVDYAEYPSLIQGGHNTYETVWGEKVYSTKKEVDILVCLSKDTYYRHEKRLSSKSLVVFDLAIFENPANGIAISIPFSEILKKREGDKIMLNMIAVGASVALCGGKFSLLQKIITDQFGSKKALAAQKNIELAKDGFEYVLENYKQHIQNLLIQKESKPQLIITGNEAFSYATVAADCRFFASYPMTPTSSVLTNLASWQQKTGMVVRHAEDEIGVINEALGASFAGARAAVATSGGGFALMNEALSYAGIAEIPIVVLLGQRPGPATGMPTWTEQGDLLFAVNSGHGEFPIIVLAPGDMEEVISITLKAFDLATTYQTPVIIMTDKLLGESHATISSSTLEQLSNVAPNYGKKIIPDQSYKRYQDTPDGISPICTPGTKGLFYQANSYEHLEDGHTTEDAKERIKQVDKRNRKIKTYLDNHFQQPVVYGDLENSDVILYSWGSSKGAVLQAQKQLLADSYSVACIHFTHIFPLDTQKIIPLFANRKKKILIENNAVGQFGKLLAMETGIRPDDAILKYDGRPIFVEEIVKKVMEHIKK